MTVRVRFAPSPTGYLHVGGARTALFNWLFARKVGGVFVLRIEDTDKQRSSQEMVDAILVGMKWLGLDWDEGPFYQADGLERHREDVHRLLTAGKAYRCFCTPEMLDARRKTVGPSYKYERTCASIARDESDRRSVTEPFTVRIRVPEGVTEWTDVVHGLTKVENHEIDDFILLRTDGSPIYNLAVVSDDIDMRITHVIRGDDHLSNTPKQILIYQGLGKEIPTFAHVPMILGMDGKKLSKRHGATAVGDYKDKGILPEAMMNFLALLGWSSGDDQEVFTAEELLSRFSLEAIHRKSAVFDLPKLDWMNGQHLSRQSAEALEPIVTERLASEGIATGDLLTGRREWYFELIDLLKVRARNVDDIIRMARPFLVDVIEYDAEAVAKHWKDRAETSSLLAELGDRFAKVDDWSVGSLDAALRSLAEEKGVPSGKLIHPLRLALTGMSVGPGVFELAAMMGREQSLDRINHAVATFG